MSMYVFLRKGAIEHDRLIPRHEHDRYVHSEEGVIFEEEEGDRNGN